MKMTEQYQKPTRFEHGHTVIRIDGERVGYIIKSRSEFRTEGENWVFDPDIRTQGVIVASNREALISKIKERYKQKLRS